MTSDPITRLNAALEGRYLKLLIGISLLLTGCVSVSKTVLIDRSASPVPEEEVNVFLAQDSVPAYCERVALLHASGPEDLTDEADFWNKLCEESGKLGANAVHIQTMEDPGTAERVASGLFSTEADRDSDAVALWCPDLINES